MENSFWYREHSSKMMTCSGFSQLGWDSLEKWSQGRMETAGQGGECWLELSGSLTALSYDAGPGCAFVRVSVFVCVSVQQLGSVRQISVSLSANLWTIAGCATFICSHHRHPWIWANRESVVLPFRQWQDWPVPSAQKSVSIIWYQNIMVLSIYSIYCV